MSSSRSPPSMICVLAASILFVGRGRHLRRELILESSKLSCLFFESEFFALFFEERKIQPAASQQSSQPDVAWVRYSGEGWKGPLLRDSRHSGVTSQTLTGTGVAIDFHWIHCHG